MILALCGMIPTSAVLTSWLTNNVIGHTKRATSLAMVVSSGALASMIGTQVYRAEDAPRYRKLYCVESRSCSGIDPMIQSLTNPPCARIHVFAQPLERGHLMMAGSILLLMLSATLLRALFVRENRRRDKGLSKGLTLIQFKSDGQFSEIGDHPNFRYTL